MQLQFSRFVESDVAEIADYIGEDNPARAETFVEELWDEVRRVAHDPLLYRLRPSMAKMHTSPSSDATSSSSASSPTT